LHAREATTARKTVQAGFKEWDVQRLDFEMSEEKPILVDAYTYTEPQQAEFDMHYCLELGVVLRGRMDRQYLSGAFSYGPGEAWLCGMWEPHGWSTASSPSEYAVIFIHPPLLAQLRFREARSVSWLAPFVAPPAARPRIRPDLRGQVVEITRGIVESAGRDAPLARIDLRLRTLSLLRLLMESWEPAERSRTAAAVDMQPIAAAMGMVFESAGFVPTHAAARACGIGRNALSRLFVDYMGISFAEFALRYRVRSAASQLQDTGDPVKAVAARWGFTDPSHFYRCFVRYYGCSPRDYRLRMGRPRGR
jgi:AraC-like DNA-binding protein